MKIKNFLFFQFLIFAFYSRAQSPGDNDSLFNSGVGADQRISESKLQNDGSIIICGSFVNYNGMPVKYLARLDGNGNLDTTLNIGTGPNSYLYSTLSQKDGKLIITGNFSSFNNTQIFSIARLNSDGSLDNTFNPKLGPDKAINCMSLQSNGKIIVSGSLKKYNNKDARDIARINTDGRLDTTFKSGQGVGGFITPGGQPYISKSEILGNGKIIIAGIFYIYDTISRPSIARLNTNGSLDLTFEPKLPSGSQVNDFAIQSDGKIVISGSFTKNGGNQFDYLRRLNENGSIDTSFKPQIGVDDRPEVVAIQKDGKIVVGYSKFFNNAFPRSIIRLNADGSLDSSFNVGAGPDSFISNLLIQEDEKIIVSGSFTKFNNLSRGRITRLNGGTISGIRDLSANDDELLVYPNPTTGIIQMQSKYPIQQIIIFNLLGETVYETPKQQNIDFNPYIDISGLRNGVYFLQVRANGRVATKKIVVMH